MSASPPRQPGAPYADWREEAWRIHLVLSARKKHWAPGSAEDRRHLAMGLIGEAGEAANLMAKEWRGDAVAAGAFAEELADIRIYLELLARASGVPLPPRNARIECSIMPLTARRSQYRHSLMFGLAASAGLVARAVERDIVEESYHRAGVLASELHALLPRVRAYLELEAEVAGVDLFDAACAKIEKLYDRWPEARP